MLQCSLLEMQLPKPQKLMHSHVSVLMLTPKPEYIAMKVHGVGRQWGDGIFHSLTLLNFVV